MDITNPASLAMAGSQEMPRPPAASAVLRAPSGLVLPGGAPLAAALGEMFTLPKLLPPEIAGHHRSAMGIHAVGEVLAGQADAGTFPVLQLPLIHKIPLLHGAAHPIQNSTSVLLQNGVVVQHPCDRNHRERTVMEALRNPSSNP